MWCIDSCRTAVRRSLSLSLLLHSSVSLLLSSLSYQRHKFRSSNQVINISTSVVMSHITFIFCSYINKRMAMSSDNRQTICPDYRTSEVEFTLPLSPHEKERDVLMLMCARVCVCVLKVSVRSRLKAAFENRPLAAERLSYKRQCLTFAHAVSLHDIYFKHI